MRSRNSLLLLMGLVGLCWACVDPKYAKYDGKNHVMCVKSPDNCPKRNIIERELTDHDKRSLVYLFNIFRSLAATGKLSGYPPAMKMEQLTWDEELATLTQKIATFCDKLDQFDVTVDRFDVVQIHEELKKPYNATAPKDKKLLDMVFDIYKRAFDQTYPANNLANYDPSLNSKKAGVLTQLLWDRTKYVGCGYRFHVYPRSTGYRKLFCIFGPAGNVKGEPVYSAGEPNCEKESAEFPGLCVTDEAEQKFLPLPCEDKDFNTKYKSALCTSRSEVYKWIGKGFTSNSWVCNDPKYANYTDLNHVMCNESPSSCTGNIIKERGLTDHDRRALLYFFNMFRSATATGKQRGYPPASNMQQLTWDDELANLTDKMSSFCDMILNKFDLTVDRFNVSQFLEEYREEYDPAEAKDKKIFTITQRVIESAFDRDVYLPKNLARYYEPTGEKKLLADSLIQLLWDRSKYIGCGYWYRHHTPWPSCHRLLFCAFGPAGKVKGEPVYKFGKPSCERESKEFPGLCVTEEDEKKFLPLPCDDSEFNATYGTQLCTYKEEQSKRIEAENSCHDPKYEKFKDRIHVMCAETPASCPKKNIIDRNITDYDKRALVHTLNVFRSLTATGQTGGYPAALNMQQLIWDEELATLANKMSTLCNHLDQYDVSVDRFDVSLLHEEIIESFDSTTAKEKKILDIALQVYSRVFDRTYPARFLAQYNSSLNPGKAHGLTQLLWARIKYVGCGFRFHTDPADTAYRRLVCLFGPAGNVEGEPVYEMGEPDCDRESTEFPGLCVTEEDEKKFLPIPCNDCDFKWKYGEKLCSSKEEMYKWMGEDVPFPYINCWDSWWRRRVRKALYAFFISAILLAFWHAYLSDKLCFPIRLVLV